MTDDRARPTPTVSRVLPDGRLVELLYDPEKRTTALAVGGPDGPAAIQDQLELADGERLVPSAADNNLIATGCVLLPSEVGTFTTQADLVSRIQTFLHRYVDLSPVFEEIAAHYVLLSWVYDAFSELPYLRLRGDYGTGKTRALIAIGSLCYKPYTPCPQLSAGTEVAILCRFRHRPLLRAQHGAGFDTTRRLAGSVGLPT